MKITNGCLVELELEVRDSEGEVVLSTEEDGPIEYLHGGEDLPMPGLERALEGAEKGAEFQLELGPDDAFGEYDVEQLVSVPRSELPADAEIVPGDWLPVTVEVEGEDEIGEIEMRVESISADAIVLDANHPLAGETVSCKAKVTSVRQPEPGELD